MRAIRNNFKLKLFAVFFLFPLFLIAQAQRNMDVSVAEKIYLQLGSGVYANDQEIWFKAIVVDSENHLPTEISGVLYVDLIDFNQKIIDQKLVKLNSGLGHGSFQLHKSYPSGRYLIRAYTQWNRNFGSDFMFEAYLDIVSPELRTNRFLDSLTMTQDKSGKFLLSAKINPSIVEPRKKNQIPIYLNSNQGRDTIEIKKRNGIFSLTYETPIAAEWMTLTLGGSENYNHSETVLLKNTVDVQFFPESGKLVHGFTNKIGVKALGVDGKGRIVSGSIIDQNGETISNFSTNPLGMGTFTMLADSSKTYQAKILFSNDTINKDATLYPLPKVVSQDSIMSVSKVGEKLWVRVSSNQLVGQAFIKISSRGKDLFLMEGPLKNGFLVKDLACGKLPNGILAFTLMNSQKQPVAERLFFNFREDETLNISVKTDKASYTRREMAKLDINIDQQDSGPVPLNASILILNKEHFQEKLINTIQSYFLLDSELRGKIEDPSYYFREQTPSRFEDLDALLLTQGWRNYKYPIEREGVAFHWPEKGIEVKGSVSINPNKQKNKEHLQMGLATFGKETKFYSTPVDSLGRFDFLLDDDYGATIPYMLSTVDSKGEKVHHKIHVNTVDPPKIRYLAKPTYRALDTVVNTVMEAGKERNRIASVFDSLYGVTQLDEVVVSDLLITPERAQLYKKYGKPDVIISGDDIRAKEKEWSYGLYSILLFNYGDQIAIERFPDGFMLAHVRGGSKEATLLMVDGKLLENHLYEYVPSMSPEIVERVELIKYAKFFKSRYLTVFPQADLFEIPSLGHIISITTKGGVGIQAPNRPEPGTLKSTLPLFSPIKEFYKPKYDAPLTTNDDKPDLRSLIHWEPSVFLNKDGNTSLNFYNGDIVGKYVIIVEAISTDGRLGYKTVEYQVKERSD